MNKPELLEALSKEAGLTKRKAEQVLDAFASIIGRSLKKGEKVTISGFGTFDVGSRKARAGVNPRTGERIKIPAMKVPRFRAGKNLKAILR
jgi:DNA-binding protein HU-beta